MGKGIYLVANLKSQYLCENLVYSVRASGCLLPIRLIHFGGEKINSKAVLDEVEFLEISDFSEEALSFLSKLKTVLSDCPEGFLYRFLPWFGNWDEFIYSDNDVVALMNWEKLFEFSPSHDIIHADEEYTTGGKYNFNQPAAVEKLLGSGALAAAITAGHFLARKNKGMITDMENAMEWFNGHEGVPKRHDQAFLHITALIGNWRILNLCKPPNNWLSSWAGDYKNGLALIQAIQNNVGGRFISHLHYSGGSPQGLKSIEQLLLSNKPDKLVIKANMFTGLKYYAGIFYWKTLQKKIKRRLGTFVKKAK